MKMVVSLTVVSLLLVGFLFIIGPKEITVGYPVATTSTLATLATGTEAGDSFQTSTINQSFVDLPNQSPLPQPPREVKAIYLTGWSAGSREKIEYLKKLARETEINAVVIDIKDYSGELSYAATIPEVVESQAGRNPKISRLNSLIKELHSEGIYLIGRVSVFQDPVLAQAHPEWALREGTTTIIWKDQKGLSWMDPAAKPVWDYNIAIAKDILARGFDEVNFDYIRFPTDGKLLRIGYPYYDKKIPKHEVIAQFFRYVRDQLPQAKLSADLFGLVTVNNDDLGIGQIIEDAYREFDYVAPMVYPSHYASGFLGYKNPADYPYEVIKYSMNSALQKLQRLEKSSTLLNSSGSPINQPLTRPLAKLRPWFQDFDLGATYDAPMVRKQITALYDSASGTPSLVQGWMMWNPSNVYTRDAFLVRQPANQ